MLTGLLAIPDFRRLWVTGLVMFVVRWVETIAFGVFTYAETNSAFAVSMVIMLRLLPMGLFGAVVGALAERMERRTALLAVVLGLFLAELVIAGLAAAGHLAVWQVALASFINGSGWAADNPIRRAMIGDAAGTERMGIAMSVDVGANNASRMLGPTVGGALLASVGIAGALALGAALYLIALVAVLRLDHRSHAAPRPTEKIFAAIAEALSFAWNDKRLFAILWVTLIYNLFGWPFTGMIPVIGRDTFGLGPEGVGLLASIDGVGAFVGAMAMASWPRAVVFRHAYIGGCLLYLLAIAVFALTPNAFLGGIALLATGFFGTLYSVMQATLIYRGAPPAMKSRMLGVLSLCIGLGPIGFFLLGTLAEAFGANLATAACALAGVLALAVTRPIWRAI